VDSRDSKCDPPKGNRRRSQKITQEQIPFFPLADHCKTTTKPTAATHQPPATETALEGVQEPSKTLDWEPDVHLLWAFFTFLTKRERCKEEARQTTA